VKPGTRALGVAESYDGTDGDQSPPGASGDSSAPAPSDDSTVSTVCGAVVRADRVVDGLRYDAWTVGGTDATDRVVALWNDLARPDVRYLLLAGVAPAWFNVVDLSAIHRAVERPVLAVSFEPSPGLEPALRVAFDGDALATRLSTYRGLPPRSRVAVGDGDAGANGTDRDDRPPLFVRAVGLPTGEAASVVRGFVPDGQRRPEPLRVARLAARAADAFRTARA
jgi:endonuclease V-like protein UPF0215 family